MIELKNISKDFGSGEKAVHAVRDVSLSIGSGEIFGIIGFSGAGKSTLVRCINLLERPSSGSVFVAGQDLTALSAKDLRAARKKIGMIFQHFNLLEQQTVLENVCFPLEIRGIPRKERQEKALELLKIVGLDDVKDELATSLPYGKQRRLEIARALATHPKLLMLDEPAAGMNPQETNELTEFIGRIRDEFHMTILLIEHHMDLVMDISDRIYVIDFGELIATGTPEEIQNNQRVIDAYLGVEEDA